MSLEPELVGDSWSIQVSKLPTNIEASYTERALAEYMEQFSDTIQNIPQATNSYMLKLITQTYDTVHTAAQEIYWLGVKYASLKDGVNPRLTPRDLENIKAIAKEVESSLWSKVYTVQLRDKDIKDQQMIDGINDLFDQGIGGAGIQSNTVNKQLDDSGNKVTQKRIPPPPPPRLSLKRQLRLLAPFLSTMALNIGSIEKFRQLGAHPQLYRSRAAARNRPLTAREKRLIEQLGRQARELQRQAEAIEVGKGALDILLGFGLLRQTQKRLDFIAPISPQDADLALTKIQQGQLENVHIVEWVTAEDDRVCTKYCLPLQGQRFILEDTATPIPIRDTHLNCRCRLLAVDTLSGGVFAA